MYKRMIVEKFESCEARLCFSNRPSSAYSEATSLPAAPDRFNG
jgi:hypothetical protein